MWCRVSMEEGREAWLTDQELNTGRDRMAGPGITQTWESWGASRGVPGTAGAGTWWEWGELEMPLGKLPIYGKAHLWTILL